jgi:hypothetical protein
MSTTVPPPAVPQSPPANRRSRRLQHPELAAAIAAVVGIFATAVGAGIGVRHVTKTGFTTTSVLGLTLLVVGLALLTSAGVVAWRTLHRWRRLGYPPPRLRVVDRRGAHRETHRPPRARANRGRRSPSSQPVGRGCHRGPASA